ncbi:oxidoreductase [Fulvitalea axinellae]|uniref:Oxidoreductase n=1 Tax=Fulvitalea axinellae TaxID=1182444 RepID=A0AAU9CX74_9BACT|nr:oxidoreductase [Fulvitalea axinellae]
MSQNTIDTEKKFITYKGLNFTESDTLERSKEFYGLMDKRRSVRDFSDKPVPKKVIDNIIRTASTAPSGAHKQPWTFCVVSNAELKSRIRKMAEEEEYKSYHGRMSDEWLDDLKPLGTDWVKEFLDIAPWLIIVMKKPYDLGENGEKRQNYYVNESVGLASGFLLAAIHEAGLVSLTHTPSPMNFLAKALERPENERPFLLIPVGYPADDCQVPDLERKPLEDVAVYYE